jgi:hypothetical protein
MKQTAHFPCWVFLSTHPIQIQRCESRSAWNFMRRHRWSRITPEKVGIRFRKLTKALGFNETDAWTYFTLRMEPAATAMGHGGFIRRVRGTAPDIAYDPDTLELLSDAFCVPMDYFYRTDVHSVPLLFGHKQRRISKQRIVQPLESDAQDQYDAMNQLGRPVIPPAGLDKFYVAPGGESLRMYHLRYEIEGSEQHRCHVVAASKKDAVFALRSKYPGAEVLEASSQRVQPGLLIESY